MNFSGLNLAFNSMNLNQKALEIVSQNISNANVEGYSREQPLQEVVNTKPMSGVGEGSSQALGARLTRIVRQRDIYMDSNFRRENISLGENEKVDYYLKRVEEVLNETSTAGVTKLLDNFRNDWHILSENPDDLSLRYSLIQDAKQLAQGLVTRVEGLSSISIQLNSEIEDAVKQVNSISAELAKLNNEILKSTPNSFEANLIQDKKDLLIDSLSRIVNIRTADQPTGITDVYLDGAPLVSNNSSFDLILVRDAEQNYQVQSSGGRDLSINGGEISGLILVRDSYIPQYKADLNEFASKLIEEVNNLHKYGYGLDGSTGLAFFSGANAEDIGVAVSLPEKLALSVPALVSVENINADNMSVDPSGSLSSESSNFKTPPDASGSFKVNGVAISWDNSDSLQGILDKIASQTGIQAKFDSFTQKITLKGPVDESSTITLEEVSGNFTAFTELAGAVTAQGSPGDGENAFKMYELMDKQVFGAETFSGRYINFIGKVGYDVSSADKVYENQKELTGSVDDMRKNVSGVSMDEEVVRMMKYQRAYEASAKLAKILDSMLDKLINM